MALQYKLFALTLLHFSILTNTFLMNLFILHLGYSFPSFLFSHFLPLIPPLLTPTNHFSSFSSWERAGLPWVKKSSWVERSVLLGVPGTSLVSLKTTMAVGPSMEPKRGVQVQSGAIGWFLEMIAASGMCLTRDS